MVFLIKQVLLWRKDGKIDTVFRFMYLTLQFNKRYYIVNQKE